MWNLKHLLTQEIAESREGNFDVMACLQRKAREFQGI